MPRKDAGGVTEDGFPGGRHFEAAPAALQQFASELIFQGMDLRAHRGLRKTQARAGAGHRTLAGDRKKVEQMMVVQSIHATRSMSR